MEIWYILLCYGVPFIPALTYIFVTNPTQGRMYKNATLWCWVSSEWDIFRIATFYGPVWYVFPMLSYTCVGVLTAIQGCHHHHFFHLPPRRRRNLQEAQATTVLWQHPRSRASDDG